MKNKSFIDRFNDFIRRIGADKVMHFDAGALISCIIMMPWIAAHGPNWPTFYYSATFSGVVVLVIEVLKEVLDDHFDKNDLFATLTGWLLVAGYLAVLTVLC